MSPQGRQLQVVARAHEQSLDPLTPAEPSFYRISDWHIDGTHAEHVVATAVCYIEVASRLAPFALASPVPASSRTPTGTKPMHMQAALPSPSQPLRPLPPRWVMG